MTANQDDPFAPFDGERTILVPSPGGRAAPQTRFVPPVADPATSSAPHSTEFDASSVGINPLVAAANPLLDIAPQLRATLNHPDPLGLRQSLVRDIEEFERRAQAAQVPHKKIIAARYALCTLLDEIASSTPWGSSGLWAKDSLLITFHSEVSGGEKFFQLLSTVAEKGKRAENLDLLELLYICLALGFEGRYRVAENGRAQLDGIRERLAQLIREEHGEYERDLSPRWQGVANRRYAPLRAIPIWAVAALCGLLLLGAYMGFRYLLNAESDPVFAKIHAIKVGEVAPKPPPPPPEVPRPRLAPLLPNEIAKNLVAVDDQDTRSVVTILGDRLFAPGSASVSPDLEPVIRRIAEALDAVPGQVVVTGHTDNQAIRSIRFPSNFHLSEERARSVVQLLAQKVAPARLTAEGRGDTAPIASNNTPEGRARNRRVEIVLTFAPPRT